MEKFMIGLARIGSPIVAIGLFLTIVQGLADGDGILVLITSGFVVFWVVPLIYFGFRGVENGSHSKDN